MSKELNESTQEWIERLQLAIVAAEQEERRLEPEARDEAVRSGTPWLLNVDGPWGDAAESVELLYEEHVIACSQSTAERREAA